MDESRQKKFMLGVFEYMRSSGIFNNQMKMASGLRSTMYILQVKENLTKKELDNCLVYFFKDYSLGCSAPLSESEIRNNLIPNVYKYGKLDFALGGTICQMADLINEKRL
jgi:hypothetical protein